MNRFVSRFDHLGLLPLVLMFLSAGCGGATCPPGSESMAGRCVPADAGLDAGPDAQADAGMDAGDATASDAGGDGSLPDSGSGDAAVPDAGPACDGGLGVCDGRCTDTQLDPSNCGACGVVCGASETCCTGACSDLSSDAAHCGSCGTTCGSSEACLSTDPRAAGAACECNVGSACAGDADCASGRTCIPELNLSTNPDELHGGGMTDALFSGGYCSSGRPGPGLSVCDPAADDCGACSSCLRLNKRGTPVYACLQDCIVGPFDNGGCRPGYQCDPVTAACIQGCTTDAQCNRVRLEDSSVTLIADGTGVCSAASSRCEHVQAPGSHTGDACPDDFSCPTNQQCEFAIDGQAGSMLWPGGYCTRTACEVAGFECSGDAVCTARSPGLTLDEPRCLKPCTFMGESGDSSLRVGATGHGVECRAGYSCVWDGTSLVGTPSSGSCQPGNYNAVASANYGASCGDDSQCYSPYGLGRCFGEPGAPHFCTLVDCTIQLTVGAACGSNVCAPISADGRIEGCVTSCTSASDCNVNQGCVVGGGSRICVNYCHSSLDCRGGQTCAIPVGETAGTCT